MIRSVLRRVLFLLDHPGSDVLSQARICIRIPLEDIGDPAQNRSGEEKKPLFCALNAAFWLYRVPGRTRVTAVIE